jgi:hypothetical protein
LIGFFICFTPESEQLSFLLTFATQLIKQEMNKFNPGDKVKFLNEKGGGTVVRMIDSRMVLVAIEDGFEIPVLANEIVTINIPKPNNPIEGKRQETIREAEARTEAEEKSRKSSLRRFAKDPEPEGIYLAFVPHEQQWILTGPLDVVLINHTPANLLYSITLSIEGGFVNADYGQIEPASKIVIETISRDDLNSWCKGMVQALLILEQSKQAFQPLYAPFDIKPNRFYKEGSYSMSAVLGDKAIMVNLSMLGELRISGNLNQILKQDRVIEEPLKKVVKEKALIDKHRNAEGQAVVDLHIGEILDNIAGLSSRDMFNIQMDYFRKTLDSAMRNEYEKVTYIHGVGNGVLKNAIISALEEFEDIGQRSASMQKFGVGAVEVLIRSKD